VLEPRSPKATRQCRSKDPLKTKTLWRLPARGPQDDVLDGRLNRMTGEALIHFLTDPMHELHGRCHRAESLFERPHAQ
jgi:hypothetical protein